MSCAFCLECGDALPSDPHFCSAYCQAAHPPRMTELQLHQLAEAREVAGICSLCVREHADCDCHQDGDGGKTRRDAYEEIQARLRSKS